MEGCWYPKTTSYTQKDAIAYPASRKHFYKKHTVQAVLNKLKAQMLPSVSHKLHSEPYFRLDQVVLKKVKPQRNRKIKPQCNILADQICTSNIDGLSIQVKIFIHIYTVIRPWKLIHILHGLEVQNNLHG